MPFLDTFDIEIDRAKELLAKHKIDFTNLSRTQILNVLQEKICNLQIKRLQLVYKQKRLPFYETVTKNQIESNIVRCPEPKTARKMIETVEKASKEKDSLGGTIQGVIKNLPVGLGEPEFDKFPALLASSMMSINATKGFEIGSGFKGTKLKGSEHNDLFLKIDKNDQVKAILFDIDGVLSKPFNFHKSLKNDWKIENSEQIFKKFWEKFEQLAVCKADTKKEIKSFCKDINWQGSVEELMEIWFDSDNKPDWQMVHLLLQLKKQGYKIYAASNQEKYRAKYLKTKQFPDVFDDWFLSCNLKMMKTEPGFFEFIRDKLQLDFKNMLLIDDTKKNIDVALKLGIQTIFHQNFSHTEEALKPFLQAKHKNSIATFSNHAGGVLGGLSSGQTVHFKVAIKPVATIGKKQTTVNKDGDQVELEAKGRHDPCVLPRAIPIVEAMAALVVMDLYLKHQMHG